MEMHPQPAADQQPVQARPRDWRMFFAGVAVAWLIPLFVAYRYGPHYHGSSEDPLTGRFKKESTWLGLTMSSRIDENQVSTWADLHSIPGIYPGQYGWQSIDSSWSRWFTGPVLGCGGGYMIPRSIYNVDVTLEGMTREQTFNKYQTECVDAYREHGSIQGVQDRWAALVREQLDAKKMPSLGP